MSYAMGSILNEVSGPEGRFGLEMEESAELFNPKDETMMIGRRDNQ